MTPPTDVFDELTAMFMTPEDPEDSTPPDISDSPASGHGAPSSMSGVATVELLIVGHLPVRAGYWLPCFVDAIASESGPAALVRLDDEHPTMELLRLPREHHEYTPSRDETLRKAIERMAQHVYTWIVRGREGIEPRDVIAATPDRVTILSGTDSAAVVRGYQIVKSIQHAAERENRPMPRCGVAIVGAADDKARETFERIQTTASNQLGVELDFRCCMSRMDADVQSNGFVQFVRDRTPSVAEIASWIREVQQQLERSARPSDSTRAEGRRSSRESADHWDVAVEINELESAWNGGPSAEKLRESVPVLRSEESARDEAARRTQRERNDEGAPESNSESDVSQTAAADVLNGREHSPHRKVKLAPKPSMELEPKRPARETTPSTRGCETPLAEFVDGLTPIEARCPRHETVELAVDDDGNIHALARETHLRDLRAVETWARDHRELLAMACKNEGVRIDPATSVRCHVFTETPVSVSDLHHSALHLHVLAPVEIEDKIGWYAAPLNEPDMQACHT